MPRRMKRAMERELCKSEGLTLFGFSGQGEINNVKPGENTGENGPED